MDAAEFSINLDHGKRTNERELCKMLRDVTTKQLDTPDSIKWIKRTDEYKS